MSNPTHEFPPFNVNHLLVAAENGELGTIQVPDVAGHPWDTSSLSGGSLSIRQGIKDVREAASKDFQSWAPNTYVAGTFRFDLRHLSRSISIIAEAMDPDFEAYRPRTLAEFCLYQRSDVDRYDDMLPRISQLGLRRFIGTVHIRRKGDSLGYSHPKYDATLDRDIFALEQPFDGDYTVLQHGQQVLVEGTVEEYKPSAPDRAPERASITIGRPHSWAHVSMRAFGRLECSSNALAPGASNDLHPPYPTQGDSVQIATIYHRSGEISRPRGLHIIDAGSAHLLSASEQRILKGLQEGDSFRELVENLESLSIGAACRLVGYTLAERISGAPADTPYVLSHRSRSQLLKILRDKLPPEERGDLDKYLPLALAPTDSKLKAEMAQHFGKETLQMTSDEFDAFALDICRGNRKLQNMESIPKLFARYDGDPDMQWRLSQAVLTSYYDQLPSTMTEEPRDIIERPYANTLLVNALRYFGKAADQDLIAGRLVQITMDAFRPEAAFPALRSSAIDAVEKSLLRCAMWSEPLVAKYPDLVSDIHTIEAVRFDEAVAVYKEAMPAIVAAVNQINAVHGWEDTGGIRHDPYAHALKRLRLVVSKFLGPDEQLPG